MNYTAITEEVAKELNLSKEVVHKTYKAYWFFIKDYIQSLPLKENLSTEELLKLRTSINIPSLGKLNVNWNRLVGCKKNLEILENLEESNAED